MATTYERHTTTTTQPQYTTTATQPHFRYDVSGDKYPYYQQHQQQGPSGSKVLAILALLPLGGILLGLAGITFVGTLIGLAITIPLFVIFSPVIVPTMLTIALAVTGFLASGTCGITGLSSLSYLMNLVRQTAGWVPDQLEYMKGKIEDVGVYAGQKTKDVGQTIQNKARDLGDTDIGVHGGYQVGAGGGGAGAGVGVHVSAGGGKEGGKEGGKGGKGGDNKS